MPRRNPLAFDPVKLLPPSVRAWMAAEIGAEIEGLILILDALDGDADSEPSLGAPEPAFYGLALRTPAGLARSPCDQTDWAAGETDDRENENEAEAGADDEPSLGSIDATADRISQEGWSQGGSDDCELGDDTGLGDEAGAWEQYRRFSSLGGDLNRTRSVSA